MAKTDLGVIITYGEETADDIPDSPDPPVNHIDVVAVCGLNDTNDCSWMGVNPERPGEVPAWLQRIEAEIRVLSFTYSPEDVLSQRGIRDVSLDLLNLVSKMRHPADHERKLLFVCHDIGGIILKNALAMAIVGNPDFRRLLASTCCIVFMGCPHRYFVRESLRISFELLAENNTSMPFRLPFALTQNLVEATMDAGRSFLDAKLPLNIPILTVSSSHENLHDRIFASFDTKLSVSCGPFPFGRFAVDTPSAHKCLGGSLPPWSFEWVLRDAVEAGSDARNRKAERLHLNTHAFLNSMWPSPSAVISEKVSSTITSIQPVSSQRVHGKAKYFAVQTPIDAYKTALAIRTHLSHNFGMHHQFFEFREWDVRCNDTIAMLCTFLAELPVNKRSLAQSDSLAEGATKHRAWSRTLLFNAFYDYLLAGNEKEYRFTWVLLNFNERVIGYSRLMSILCGLLRESELDFTLVIVNDRPHDLSDYLDCFETILINNSDEMGTIEKPTPSSEDPNGYAIGSDVRITIAPEALELSTGFPSLHGKVSSISKLLHDCEDDGDLRRMVFILLQLRAPFTTSSGIDELLAELFPVRPERVFEYLCQPPSACPVSKEQIRRVTTVLLVACRPLTTMELYDLEKRTSYGDSIGRIKVDEDCSTPSPKSLYILQGIAHFQQGEIWFCHHRFRDWAMAIIGQDSNHPDPNNRGGESECHYKMAEWCLERIRNATPEEWEQCQTDDERSTLPDTRQSFLAYAVKSWPRHAAMTGLSADNPLFMKSFLGNREPVRNWIKAYWSLSGPIDRVPLADVTPLTILAGFGSIALVDATIDASAVEYLSSRGEVTGALTSAIRRGHRDVVQRLLALPTIQDSDTIDDLILYSIGSETPDLAHETLPIVIKHPQRLEDPVTVLGWAAYHGLEEAVEWIIPMVSAETVKSGTYLPIYLASRSSRIHQGSCPRTIERLIEAGYPLKDTTTGEGGSSAFDQACIMGNRVLALSLAEYLTDSPSEVEGHLRWPASFQSGVQGALENRHCLVLSGLLEFALAKYWIDLPAIAGLIDGSDLSKTPRCYNTLISHVLTLTKRSPELSAECQRILFGSFKSGAFFILPELLEIPHSVLATEFPSMLNSIINMDKQGAPCLHSLLESGKVACDSNTYNDALAYALGLAVEDDKTTLIEELLKWDPPLNTRSYNDRTPLYNAAYIGYEASINLLIAAGADVNAEGNDTGWAALHGTYDNADLTRTLLQAHCEVNAKDSDGETALFFACRYNCLETVQVLLEYGAQVCTYRDCMTELSTAVREGNHEIVGMLLAAGADPRQYSAKELEYPLLHTCVTENDADTLKVLLLHDVLVDEIDDCGNTPLHCVTSSTNVQIVQLLVSRGASLTIVNEGEWTPLAWAIGSSNCDVTEWLVKRGASLVAHVDRYGSLIHIACYMSDLETVKLLHSKEVDMNENDPGISGTPLHSLLHRPNDEPAKGEIFDYLISLPDFELDQPSAWWGSPLSTACLCADLSMVTTLIERGLDTNTADGLGRRPIHFALYRELGYVRLLQDNDADLQSTDSMGRCALHFAVVSGRLDVVKHVLEYDETMVHRKDIDNWTPLMWALRYSTNWEIETAHRADIVKELIIYGADKTVQGQGIDRTWTAEKIACYHGLEREIIDLVTPAEVSSWAKRDSTRKARETDTAFCDVCLMSCWGIDYVCDTCTDYYLCFKCYRSRDTIHPEHLFSSSDESAEYESDSSPAGTASGSTSMYSESVEGETNEAERDEERESTEEVG